MVNMLVDDGRSTDLSTCWSLTYLLPLPLTVVSAQKPAIAHDLATAVPSAILLGFGIVFLALSVGLYV